MGRLDGRVVIVTGAARGQGEQEARLFRAEGAEVLLA
ncbi:short-chain dehydrogenase, partial [Streptomyces nigra]